MSNEAIVIGTSTGGNPPGPLENATLTIEGEAETVEIFGKRDSDGRAAIWIRRSDGSAEPFQSRFESFVGPSGPMSSQMGVTNDLYFAVDTRMLWQRVNGVWTQKGVYAKPTLASAVSPLALDPQTRILTIDLSTYAKTSALSAYATVASLSGYVTSSSLATTLQGYVRTADLAPYALASSLSGYVQTSTLANYSTTAQTASSIAAAILAALVGSGGLAGKTIKVWTGQATTDASGNFTIGYSAAGFTAPPWINVQARCAGNAAANAVVANLQTPTASSCPGFCTVNAAISLLGLVSLLPLSKSGAGVVVDVLAIGY